MRAKSKTHIKSSDKATQEWLKSQKERTRFTYVSFWGYFLEFTGLTGDQILESRRADKEFTWEKRVMEFKEWLIKKGLSEKTGSTGTSIVRGFFSYYRVALQFRRGESAKLKEAEPKYEDYRFSREDLKKMFDVSDLTERYVITTGKSFGLRAGDFLKLTRGDLEPYLDRPMPISIGEYTTAKEKVKAYPMIDSDAYPIIKLMIEAMDREEGRKEPEERILEYTNEIQLSRVLQRVAVKAGIKHGNKRVRFHCLRKFLIDRLSSHMSESKWKQIVGKKISEGAYVSPDSLREDYARVMPETCFTSTPEGDMAQIAKLEVLKQVAKNLGFTDDDLKGLGAHRLTIKQIEALEQMIEKKRKPENDCPNGTHCQRVVNEEELPSLLSEGWHASLVLPSGKVVVSR
jgi:integrase